MFSLFVLSDQTSDSMYSWAVDGICFSGVTTLDQTAGEGGRWGRNHMNLIWPETREQEIVGRPADLHPSH